MYTDVHTCTRTHTHPRHTHIHAHTSKGHIDGRTTATTIEPQPPGGRLRALQPTHTPSIHTYATHIRPHIHPHAPVRTHTIKFGGRPPICAGVNRCRPSPMQTRNGASGVSVRSAVVHRGNVWWPKWQRRTSARWARSSTLNRPRRQRRRAPSGGRCHRARIGASPGQQVPRRLRLPAPPPPHRPRLELPGPQRHQHPHRDAWVGRRRGSRHRHRRQTSMRAAPRRHSRRPGSRHRRASRNNCCMYLPPVCRHRLHK